MGRFFRGSCFIFLFWLEFWYLIGWLLSRLKTNTLVLDHILYSHSGPNKSIAKNKKARAERRDYSLSEVAMYILHTGP